MQTFRAGRIVLALDPVLHGPALRRLASQHGASLFLVLLAALRALLARYTGQPDSRILQLRDCQSHHREVEDLVGFFVNTVVLRTQVHDRDRFVDLLAREKECSFAAYAHQDAPFEMIIESLGIERSLNRMPLIQVMCVDHEEDASIGELSGLATEVLQSDVQVADFDLTVETRERKGTREITVTYNDDLFSREEAFGTIPIISSASMFVYHTRSGSISQNSRMCSR